MIVLSDKERMLIDYLDERFNGRVYVSIDRMSKDLNEDMTAVVKQLHKIGILSKMVWEERYKLMTTSGGKKVYENYLDAKVEPFLLGECMKSIVGRVDYEALQSEL